MGRKHALPPGSLDKYLIPASSARGLTLEAKEHTALQPAEWKLQTQKVRQNEVGEEYVPDEGTRWNLRTTKWGGDRQSTPLKFRGMILKMILDLRKRIEVQDKKIQKMFNKDLEDIKKWVEQYNNWKEKYTRRINRINEAEEWISELEERIVKITVTE